MEKREPPSYTARLDGAGTSNTSEKQASSTSITSTDTIAAASASTVTPTSAFQSKFASLSLHQNDKIRLLDFPNEAVEVVKSAIRTGWPYGLQDQRHVHGSTELKLKGLLPIVLYPPRADGI